MFPNPWTGEKVRKERKKESSAFHSEEPVRKYVVPTLIINNFQLRIQQQKTRWRKLSSSNLVFIIDESDQNLQNPVQTLQKCSWEGPWVRRWDISDSQWCCWSRQRTGAESSDQSLPAPRTSEAAWGPSVIITGRMLPSDAARVPLMFRGPQSHRALICIRGDSLAHARRSWEMQLRYTYERTSVMGPEMTRIILSSVTDRSDYGLLWAENSGPVRAKGGLGEEGWIKSM